MTQLPPVDETLAVAGETDRGREAFECHAWAHDLDDPDAERADPHRAPRPRSHGGTVGRDRAAVVRPRSQLALRQPE